MRNPVPVAVIVLAVVLAGCSGGRRGGGGIFGDRDGGPASLCGRCPSGTTCNPMIGCVGAMACEDVGDCVDEDACTSTEWCDRSSRRCVYEILDGDRDGEPPEICGGRDCDDADALLGIGSEQCDGVDNDCDTRIDESSSSCGEGQRCVDGLCECDGSGTRNCAGTCVDISSDVQHCGGCYRSCEGSCVGGACQCPAGLTACSGGCVDTANDSFNCGGCGVLCSSGTCTGGVCPSCGRAGDPCCPGSTCDSGATCDAGTCVACGGLGDACCTGGTCAAGMCVRDVCSEVRCDEPYPAIPSGGLPRCSAATWTCIEGCTTSACLTSCMTSDTTPAYMGINCQTCVNHQIIYCGDRSGCTVERQAWECCLETNCPPGSGATCPDMCNPQRDAFTACLDTRAPTCRDINSTYARMCFP